MHGFLSGSSLYTCDPCVASCVSYNTLDIFLTCAPIKTLIRNEAEAALIPARNEALNVVGHIPYAVEFILESYCQRHLIIEERHQHDSADEHLKQCNQSDRIEGLRLSKLSDTCDNIGYTSIP